MWFIEYWVEIVGYTGSFLVALSLSMKSISKLRKINLVGASTFAAYGLLVGAYPVFALNSFISAVDIYYLLQMRKQNDYFELLPITTNNSPFLLRFLEFHAKDIAYFFPQFKFDANKDYLITFVLRNLLPVSLFIAQKENDSTLKICLDYSIPAYRDLRNAHYLYYQGQRFFDELNYKKLITHSNVAAHQKYLLKMGFIKNSELGENWYQKEI